MNGITGTMARLTRRQRSVLTYLQTLQARGAPPPTLQELADGLGLTSRGSLHKHVEALIEAGLVEPQNGKRRGVLLRQSAPEAISQPTAQEQPVAERANGRPDHRPDHRPGLRYDRLPHRLPMLGRIAAGRPIEAVQDTEMLEVPSFLFTRDDCYVLQVRGDSMIEDGIFDGDLIVVEPRDTAGNGDLVVALVDGERATVKRILQRPHEVVLIPANAALEPMHYAPERVQIQGVVVGQMRRYR